MKHSIAWIGFKKSFLKNIQEKASKWAYFIFRKERKKEFLINYLKPYNGCTKELIHLLS